MVSIEPPYRLLINSSVLEQYRTEIVNDRRSLWPSSALCTIKFVHRVLKAIEISNIATADGAAYLEKEVFGIIAFA